MSPQEPHLDAFLALACSKTNDLGIGVALDVDTGRVSTIGDSSP